MKKQILTALLALVFLLQMVTFTTFAETVHTGKVTVDMEEKEVTFSGTGFEETEHGYIIRAFYAQNETRGILDYVDQIKPDAEGNLEFTYPTFADGWIAGRNVQVYINDEHFRGKIDEVVEPTTEPTESPDPDKVPASISQSGTINVKVGREQEVKITLLNKAGEVVPGTVTWEELVTGQTFVECSETGKLKGLKVGIAMFRVTVDGYPNITKTVAVRVTY